MTIDVSLIMGPGDLNAICGGDRADVIALKAIVNVMTTTAAFSDVMGVPAMMPIEATGKERATAMIELFANVIGVWWGGDFNGEDTQIAELIADSTFGTAADTLKATALSSPSFELFALVIGALDDFVDPATGTSSDFPQYLVDPAVSYRDTSLLNMPKSEFDIMIDSIHSGVTTSVTAKSVKDQYQSLINMAGGSSAVEQVFWNFLKDAESPVYLSDYQLNAIAQAMAQADFSHFENGRIFCGALTSLNQILRSGILSYSETDAIMREIQEHHIAVPNVAVMMELMNFLEDGAALAAAGADYSARPPKTRPTSQESLDASYASWPKIDLYSFPVDPMGSQIDFDLLDFESVYSHIITAAVDSGPEPATCGGIIAGCTADDNFKRAILEELWQPLYDAHFTSQTCVDSSLGAPKIYKDVLYHYLTAGATPLQYPLYADFPADLTGWKHLHAEAVCWFDAPIEAGLSGGQVFACQLARCIESMNHVTFANPAGEVCDDITACLMLTGDTDAVTKFTSWCQAGDFKYGLNQVLSAVAVFDADPGNDLETTNGLFKDGTDFTGIHYQSQAPVKDEDHCPGWFEQRPRGIITGGFVSDELQNINGPDAVPAVESQPVWKPTKTGGHKRWLTDSESPDIYSLDEVMNIALDGHVNPNLLWTWFYDDSLAVLCPINACMACPTDTKIISTTLQDGRISSECVCPAIVSDIDGDGLADTPDVLEWSTPELAQPIYAQVVLNYFKNWELKPPVHAADSADGIAIPAEKFRPDELKIIAAALADLPAPTGQSMGVPMTQTQYMTHTRGILIQHLMSKIYAKNNLDLETRIQGAIDETQFRHNLYFILETLFQVELEIRADYAAGEDPDFSILNKLHVESSGFTILDGVPSSTATLDWRHPAMTGNTADILSQAYMDQILSGLAGGIPESPILDPWVDIIKTAVREHYDEIYLRTSELFDCINREKERIISWICDERIPEADWTGCAAGQDQGSKSRKKIKGYLFHDLNNSIYFSLKYIYNFSNFLKSDFSIPRNGSSRCQNKSNSTPVVFQCTIS